MKRRLILEFKPALRLEALWVARPLVGLLVVSLLPCARATDYYVSPAGNDRNPGPSASRPWRTVSRVNRSRLYPGDRILFEGGRTFSGNLVLTAEDAGTTASPVTVSSYGTGRATIQAGSGTGILVENAAGFIVSHLVVTGAGRTANHGSGIWFANRLPGGVKLAYVRVDDVEVSRFGKAGILVGGGPQDASKSGFSDVSITHATAHDNAYYGIWVSGAWNPGSCAYANSDVYIGYCRAFDNAGDPAYRDNQSRNGILIEDVDRGTIERSVAYHNGWLCNAPNGPVGIWAHSANRVTIQHCESYGNRTGRSVDGGGFDFDGGVSDSIMQYNYSHNNDGAGYLLYVYRGAPHAFRNNILRYNISENDGRKNGYPGIYVGNDGSGVSDLEIYGNTVFMGPVVGGDMPRAVQVRGTTNVHFRNNIFVTAGDVPLLEAAASQPGLLFQGNDYWSGGSAALGIKWADATFDSLDAWRTATGQETQGNQAIGLSADPRLTSPGQNVVIDDPNLLSTLVAYKLRPGSPLIGAGLDLRRLFSLDPGGRDFFGNPLPARGPLDIGAHQATRNHPPIPTD